MENRKWFTLADGVVRGPFRQEDIESRISVMENTLIWGRGCAEWISPKKWNDVLKESNNQMEAHLQQEERLWRIALGTEELTPMTYAQMMLTLKGQPDLSGIKIWTEGYSDWKDVFQIHKIMDELGVSRRTHPRVPIMGTLNCEGASGNFTARVLSISEGGLGVTDTNKVKIGEKLKVTLRSTQLHSPIQSTVEVVYVGNDGYLGMKFLALPREAHSAIIDYIKKFQSGQG